MAALLGAIDCPIQPQDHTFRDVYARRGLHVDFLLELPIEVGSLDVHLVDGEVLLNDNGEDGAECGEFDNWGKCLVIVEAFNLSKALSHNVSLVLLYTAVWTTLVMKNPLTTNDLAVLQARDCIINSHHLEVLDFILTGGIPIGSIAVHHGLLVSSQVMHLISKNDFGLLYRAGSAVRHN